MPIKLIMNIPFIGIDRESFYHKRALSEMIHINFNKETINKKEDIQSLNSIYKVYLNGILK